MAERLKDEHIADYKIRVAQTDLLERGLVFADQFINRQYMVGLPMYAIRANDAKSYNPLRMYHLNKLVYEADENLSDKLVSLYGALNSIQSTALLVLQSSKDGVELYLGTQCAQQPSTAGSILQAGINGNFTGSAYESLQNSEIQRLLSKPQNKGSLPCVSTVTLVPSLRDEEKENSVQGIEKLMDALSGREFTAILIAEPMHPGDIEVQKRGLEEMYSTISPFAETTLAYGNNSSYAVADGTFTSFANSLNNSVTNTNSESISQSTSSGTSSSSGSSFGGDGFSFNGSSGSSYSSTYGSSSGWSKAVTSGETKTTSSGNNQTITNTVGESRTLTIKHVNKSVSEMMTKIDKQLERIRGCESFGLWSAAAYFISDDVQVASIAASTFRALVAGDSSYMDKALINIWDSANEYTPLVLDAITHGRHPRINVPRMNEFDEQVVKPAVLVSGKELPIFMSLPRKSLPGVLVDYMASFGRSVYNPYEDSRHQQLRLGCVRHKGVANSHLPVNLDVEELRTHCFITGSTGSGKSNTTYHLLNELLHLGKKFLVIEPAKGEYKHAFGGLSGINIFWTNPKQYRLLRLNPFSFPEDIHVLEHMDRLIEILNGCWPLYSAMPAILKAAIERSYASCGWDLANSIRIDNGKPVFPTFGDLLRELPRVINESSYSAEAKGDYTGALVTRVASLTNGIMGSIFCSDHELDDEVLFDQNTIVDLSRVGSSETKAMMMGVLIMKLNEYRMSSGTGMNAKLKHITVIEEAHNLLRRTSGGASELAAKSVEMISNSIAEMRTYGEGFLIVDQSPTSVDISAIKNTNTKIVMRLPEQADFEAVGGSFGLTPEQIREISRLPRGSAIVSQSGWLEPVLTAIDRASDAYEVNNMSTETEVDRKAIASLLDTALGQADNMLFNEHAFARILRKQSFSPNRADSLLSTYRIFAARCEADDSSMRRYKAEYVIRTIGCAGLANIFPLMLNLKADMATNIRILRDWKKQIANALDTYGDFGDEERRVEIADDLFVYMVQCECNAQYIRNSQILKALQQKK